MGYRPQVPLLWDKHRRRALRAVRRGERPAEAKAARFRNALLEEVHFARFLDFRVEELSGRTKQKLNVTLALLHGPQLLLLDEPYAGFDWETYLRL